MSDTVKIIIEIPKDHYEFLVDAEEILSSPIPKKDDSKDYYRSFMRVIYSAIAKGTPLDDILNNIRAEIQENINYNKKMNYQGIVAGLLLTLDIIDKYNAESKE